MGGGGTTYRTLSYRSIWLSSLPLQRQVTGGYASVERRVKSHHVTPSYLIPARLESFGNRALQCSIVGGAFLLSYSPGYVRLRELLELSFDLDAFSFPQLAPLAPQARR